MSKPCSRCGTHHERCSAHINGTDTPCRAYPMPGLEVCRFHGGGTKMARAAGRRRVRQAELTKLATEFATLEDTTPTEALLREVQRSAGLVSYYSERVQELEQRDRDLLTVGLEVREHGIAATGEEVDVTTTSHDYNIWMRLFNEERDRLVRMSSAALRAGIEERRVRLAEQQGSIVAEAIRNILSALLDRVLPHVGGQEREAVEEAWRTAVPVVVPAELRALEVQS